MDWYGAPGGEYLKGVGEGGYPGSDPQVVAKHLFDERGLDVAILHPMTRGIMPDRHLGTAIAAAHNEILVTRWLDHSEFGERFGGTIRVNPDDIPGALREIDTYKDHPRVVQIGIPLQSRELFGKPQFWPLWEAAVDARLPVCAHIEVGSGITAAPTPSGNTRTYEQYVGFMALNYLYHLMNMLAEGVFERMPELKFVWADGAADLLTPDLVRIRLDRTVCDGFRACATRAPALFSLDDWGYASLIGNGVVGEEDHDAVMRAILDCPVHAILEVGEYRPGDRATPADSDAVDEPELKAEGNETEWGFVR